MDAVLFRHHSLDLGQSGRGREGLGRWRRGAGGVLAFAHRPQPCLLAAGPRHPGGSQALRDGLRQLRDGGLAITPDGPRGPMREMAEGLPLLAKLSKAPALFIGMSCNPAIRLNSWDRAVLPLPFGKGAIVWDVAHYPEGAELAEVAGAWTERLTAVEAAADAVTGLERI